MTIDKTRPRGKKASLPAFTPVPRHYQRHDGWTPERQLGFIEALADTGSVKAAAHRVNMTPEGAYLLRRHTEAATFRTAWEAALALGVQQLEDIALERALYGTEVPVYSYGKLIGSRIVHNDRLLMFMLKNRAPTRFAADGRVTARRSSIGDPKEAARLGRYKKQWRKEWDEERARDEAAEADENNDALDAQLDRLQEGWLEDMTSATRALYDTYAAAADADQEAGRTAWNEEGGATLIDQPGHESADQPGDEWDGANITRRIELSDFTEDQEHDQ